MGNVRRRRMRHMWESLGAWLCSARRSNIWALLFWGGGGYFVFGVSPKCFVFVVLLFLQDDDTGSDDMLKLCVAGGWHPHDSCSDQVSPPGRG